MIYKCVRKATVNAMPPLSESESDTSSESGTSSDSEDGGAVTTSAKALWGARPPPPHVHLRHFTEVSTPREARQRVGELLRRFFAARALLTARASAAFQAKKPSYTPLFDVVEEFSVLLVPVGWWAASEEGSGISDDLRGMCEQAYLEGVAYKLALLSSTHMLPMIAHARLGRDGGRTAL